MRKNRRKVITLIATTVISIMLIGVSAYAHSGRTDSSGGHKDNKNKSGLGSYHYHCGGNPPHLHNNGVCPYSASASSSAQRSGSSPLKSSDSSVVTTPMTIIATSIQINEKIEKMIVGDTKQLTASILPEDTTDKTITWKSSDESVITTNELGEIVAKKTGIADITVSTANGKTNTIKINVVEDKKEENNIIKETSTNLTNTNYEANRKSRDSNAVTGFITLGALGGGGYWGYKKYKQ